MAAYLSRCWTQGTAIIAGKKKGRRANNPAVPAVLLKLWTPWLGGSTYRNHITPPHRTWFGHVRAGVLVGPR
jgi:hypothetical protein